MKIYTKTGDEGETGLFGGARVRKNDPRVEAYGTVDELNATLGLVRASELPKKLDAAVSKIQSELFVVGAELACAAGKEQRMKMSLVGEREISALERLIDELEETLPSLTNFILPAGSPAGAALHLSRTVARRAERRCLDVENLRPELLIYLNRLSDCLFVLARSTNQVHGTAETPWVGRGNEST